jgi:hypothetical protein
MFLLLLNTKSAIGTGSCIDEACEIDRPERRAAGVGIEGVERVAHRRDIYNVVGALTRDGNTRHVQRLREDGIVHGQHEDEAELA